MSSQLFTVAKGWESVTSVRVWVEGVKVDTLDRTIATTHIGGEELT